MARGLTVALTAVALLLWAGLAVDPAMAYALNVPGTDPSGGSAAGTGSKTTGESFGSLPAGVMGVETEHLVMRLDDKGLIITDAARLTNRTSAKIDRLTFPLPKGYSELAFRSGLTDSQVDKTADGFVARDGLAAGASLDVAFSYRLPASGKQGTVERKVSYLTGNLSIVVQVDQLGISGDGLVAGETVSLNGATFREYHRESIPAGSTVAVAWTAGPSTGNASSGAGASNSVISRLSGGALPIALLLLVVVVVAGGASVYARRKTGRPATAGAGGIVAAPPLADRQAELIHYIATLDRSHQAGQLTDETYRAERSKAKGELVQVMLAMRGSGQG